MEKEVETLFAEYGDLRLLINGLQDGWRVYAFQADEATDDSLRRGPYSTVESAKRAAVETATELLGCNLRADELEWALTTGDRR
jgi:hypothetical protein